MKRWFNSTFPARFVFSYNRMSDGYAFAIAFSLVLHIIMFTLLLASWPVEHSVKIAPPMPVSAVLVELPKSVAKPPSVKKPAKAELAERKRMDAGRKQVEAKKLAAAQTKADQQRQEQERQKALTLKREREKKAALRAKEEAARELQKKQEKRRQEEDLRRKEQEAWEQALAAEQQALQQAQKLEHDQLEQAKYAGLIKSLASQYWSRPPSARNNMVAEVRISLSPFGDVLDITMVKSSGNDEFDRSVIQAVRRASPFTELKRLDRRIFDQYFRRITLRFRPEDLVR